MSASEPVSGSLDFPNTFLQTSSVNASPHCLEHGSIWHHLAELIHWSFSIVAKPHPVLCFRICVHLGLF